MDGNDESSQYTESGPAVIDTMTMAPIAKPPSIFLIHPLSKVPLLELTISTLGSHDFCVAMVTRRFACSQVDYCTISTTSSVTGHKRL